MRIKITAVFEADDYDELMIMLTDAGLVDIEEEKEVDDD